MAFKRTTKKTQVPASPDKLLLDLPQRPACGYDGQAATRLAHIPTGAATATGRSIQEDFGGMSDNRNIP